jgi:hypothetical protein
MKPYLKKPFTKIGLVEWLKVKTLSSSPSTANKTNKEHLMSCVLVLLLRAGWRVRSEASGYPTWKAEP